MEAIGYVRCSTLEQADSGLGLEAQDKRIRAYATLKGLRLVEIIQDAGVSGGKPLATRDGGAKLLDIIRRKKAGAVVMLKLDRMFRNAGDCLTTVDQWERQGISLHIADLGGNAIDTTSAAGRFMLVVLAGAAEMERNMTRERTRAALAVMRSNGQRTGGIPFGFDVAADGTSLIENLAEQTVLADIRDMRSRVLKLKSTRALLSAVGKAWNLSTIAETSPKSGCAGPPGTKNDGATSPHVAVGIVSGTE